MTLERPEQESKFYATEVLEALLTTTLCMTTD